MDKLLGSGGRSSSTILKRVVKGSNSAYGGCPVSISITVHPNDQISLAGDAPFSSITSGATKIVRAKR
jgi:hypothetical protein